MFNLFKKSFIGIDKILNISAEDKVRFIPAILQKDDLNILQQIKKLI